MLEPVARNSFLIQQQANEHTPLLPTYASPLNAAEQTPDDTTQSVVNWFKHYVTPVTMPVLYALNGSAITSTIITLSAGWPKKVPKVIAPAMYIGLPFNAIGFLDALAIEYKINRLNKFRHGYRVLIYGTNTALFSLQLLIAILDDIYQTQNKPFDVSNAAFAGICVGPALLGLITIVVQGFNVQRPSDLKSLKNKIRYALLALLDLTNNASTAHSFIQDIAALTHPLTSPLEMSFRYFFALAPALVAEGVKVSEHIPENWVSRCLQNFPRSFLSYLRASPEQLFLIISALNYAIFNEEVMRNNEKDFSVTGATLTMLFWFYVVLLPLVIRCNGGLSPLPESEIRKDDNAILYPTYYDNNDEDDDALLSQGASPLESPADSDVDEDLEEGRRVIPQQAASIATGAHAGSHQSVSHNDSHAAPATGPTQEPPAARTAPAKPPVKQQLPVVLEGLPLAPNSAQLTRRLSLHAEMQRPVVAQQPAATQQPADTQHSSRAQLFGLVVAPAVTTNKNNPLRRST